MRFLNRKEGEETAQAPPESPESGMAPSDSPEDELAATPAAEAGPPSWHSQRLQRVVEHFQTQHELVTDMWQQFDAEMDPLRRLLTDQAAASERIMECLDELLRPLSEYADSEEANLAALEKRMTDSGADRIARSFSGYLAAQRARLTATREQIDQERMPFLEYTEEQGHALEVALSRFDDDIEALELNLDEQRKVMMRMLESMRSNTFNAVTEYLVHREQALAAVAESGSLERGHVVRSMQQFRQALEPLAADRHIRAVLDRTEQADQRLVAAGPAGGRAARLGGPHDREAVAPGATVIEDGAVNAMELNKT